MPPSVPEVSSSTNPWQVRRARETLDALHRARQSGRRVPAATLLEPGPGNAQRIERETRYGFLPIELPIVADAYELRGLWGITVVLAARARSTEWLLEFAPRIARVQPAALYHTWPGVHRGTYELAVVPLAAPREVEPEPPVEERPWWELEIAE